MAPFIAQEKISEIQRSINIIDIVSDYIALKQAGKNHLGLCPFHHEKTPSFTVNEEKQIYKCFGCGEGGTIFNFLMKQESLTFPEAVNVLAEKANIRIDIIGKKEKHQGPNILFKANEHATRLFVDMLLKTKEGKRPRDYISSRSINDNSIRKFKLGYSPNRWDSILNLSKRWGIETELLEKAGLIIRKQDKCYDRFRNRLMFPIFDSQNRPVGFGARALDNSLPKYLNSPETPIFSKSKTLYGINLAKEPMRKNRKVLLMEGYTDVIIAHQHGIDWSIAVLGTALTREHVRMLKRYCDKAILVFDADTAGQKSSEKNLDVFIEEDFDVNIVLLPEGYDPYDYIVKNGKQKFLEQVEKAYDFFSFKTKLSEKKWDMSSISGRTSAIDDILSTVIKIPDILKRDLTIKRVAEEMFIDELLIRNRLNTLNGSTKFNGIKRRQTEAKQSQDQIAGKLNKTKSADYQVEMSILCLMINRNDLIEKVETEIGFDSFRNNEILSIAKNISEIYSNKGKVILSDIFPMLDSPEMSREMVDTISKQESLEGCLISGNADTGEKMLKECIQYIRKKKNRKSQEQAKKKMSDLYRSQGNKQEVDQILAGFHKKSITFHSFKKSG
ncbi:DNA primase [Candidatus Scalindua japonica]|uniref:DNA primase n=1 Tax=Candidatus Scalindua japonica TaxID=1284222 RepID=A0A286TXC2_9BACT|nr:DNA primase [Candidatus Scalindua japonica]GAX60504.1 DNA primase [Candidatus Scalindua japonica]